MQHETFIGRVVSVKDPDEAGRIQIRIYGLHDNTTSLPDDQCPWARCVFPVTNPVHQGIASATTGIVVNSTVVGYFIDADRQLPLITGVLGASANNQSDFPKADRGSDHNDVLQKSLPSIGSAQAKNAIEKTIGNIPFIGQEIDELLGQIGAGGILGNIKQGLNIVHSFDDLKNNLLNSSIGNLNGMVQGFVSNIGSNIEQAVDNVVTNELGNVINLTESLDTWKLQLFNPLQAAESVASQAPSLAPLADTINHLAGNIATKTSTLPINTLSDALGRLNGFRFVMGGVMSNLESSLNNLLEI